MNEVRRWFVSVSAVVLLATSSVVAAQGTLAATHASDERGAALLEFLLANDDLRDDLYARVRGALTEGMRILAPLPAHEVPAAGVCAYLVGTGGSTPRLDGGGDLLAAIGGLFDRTRAFMHPSIERVHGYPHQGPALVIVDEFSLEALAVSLRRFIEHGIDADIGGDDPLWEATYGYRISLRGEEPRQPESTRVPHGHLVAYHALSQLPRGSRITGVTMPNDRRVEVDVYNADFGELAVHFVDIDFDDIASIRDGLSEATNVADAALVLSWGMVDCELAARYAALPADSSIDTIMEFLVAALREDATAFESLARRLCAAFVGPMPQALDLPTGTTCQDVPIGYLVGLAPIVAVAGFSDLARAGLDPHPVAGRSYFAAAGNQGLGFPMPPASWPEVIGVEACAADTFGSPLPDRASFSNVGAVGDGEAPSLALGAWFVTPEVRTDEYGAGDPSHLGYWGTSFAAPTAALRFIAATGGFDHDTQTCR